MHHKPKTAYSVVSYACMHIYFSLNHRVEQSGRNVPLHNLVLAVNFKHEFWKRTAALKSFLRHHLTVNSSSFFYTYYTQTNNFCLPI